MASEALSTSLDHFDLAYLIGLNCLKMPQELIHPLGCREEAMERNDGSMARQI